jgi:hypothetical protein
MSELKYLYACLKNGTVVSISDADKSQEYYLYPGEQVKLILRQGKVYQKHFAVKSEDLLINGNRVRFNSINESPQHYNFKMNILKEGYFYYKQYKILIKNAKVEPRILNSSYRADVFGELLCGTTCIIEVIKTSKVSEVKKEFINKNQILTFEIIIDKDGNQIIEQSNCYGNTELERLTSEITKSEKKFKSEARGLYSQHEREKWSIDNRVETAIRNAGGSIRDIQREYSEKRTDCEKNVRRFEDYYRRDTEWLERARAYYGRIEKEIRDIRAKITSVENKISSNPSKT